MNGMDRQYNETTLEGTLAISSPQKDMTPNNTSQIFEYFTNMACQCFYKIWQKSSTEAELAAGSHVSVQLILSRENASYTEQRWSVPYETV